MRVPGSYRVISGVVMVAILFAPMQALSARHAHGTPAPQSPAQKVELSQAGDGDACAHAQAGSTQTESMSGGHAAASHDADSCSCSSDCSCHCDQDVLHPALTGFHTDMTVLVNQLPQTSYMSVSPIVLPVENPPPLVPGV